VAPLDLDPQESLASWWTRRGKTRNPKLFEVDTTAEAIELLVSEGWQWVFIDTGPARIEMIEPGLIPDAFANKANAARLGEGFELSRERRMSDVAAVLAVALAGVLELQVRGVARVSAER
jgi:hypothetical protein